jgi:hypothetical protein
MYAAIIKQGEERKKKSIEGRERAERCFPKVVKSREGVWIERTSVSERREGRSF